MAHFLFAWELGGGLGHAGRIKPLALEVQRRGHATTLVLRDLVQTDQVLREVPGERLQAPLWMFRTVGVPEPPVSLAEILLSNGYLQPQHLRAQVQGWLSALRLCGAQALVCDYAPTAVLAARVAGLPVATLGIGFYMPPDVQPLPPFRDWEPLAAGRVAHAEAQVLATVNAVLHSFDRPPLQRLWQLFAGDRPLLCSWPEFDHYAVTAAAPAAAPLARRDVRWFGPNFTANAAGQAPPWPAGPGPRVFAYLKSAHPDHVQVLQALDQAGCRTLCYLPELASGKPPPYQAASVAYSAAPVPLGPVFADECALVVCHAGEATLAQALLAGVPVLLLPMNPEQFLMARAVGRTGAGLNAAEQARPLLYTALVRQLLQTSSFTAAARAFAARYASFSHAAQTQALGDQFEALLASDAVPP